jgi:acetyl-CoA carboxylase carboxyl transferase subunit alpha
MTAYERLNAARAKGRPTASAFIENLFTDFFELHGDHGFADDKAVMAGLAELNGLPVTVIGLEKGKDTKDKIQRNFGSAHPEGYRKALRLMKQAEKFGRPVVCIVDTAGAYCGIGAEERGQGMAIAKNMMEMMTLKTPVVSIVISEGGSGGAIALSVADEVWMLENAVYSVISPEGAASIIWKDASKVKEASENLKMTAQDLLKLGIIERIFDEPEEFPQIYEKIREALAVTLNEKMAEDRDKLLFDRYRRFRKFGEVTA